MVQTKEVACINNTYLVSPIALFCVTVSAPVRRIKHDLTATVIIVLNQTTVMKLIHSDWLISGA
jgi:hypothetical protein